MLSEFVIGFPLPQYIWPLEILPMPLSLEGVDLEKFIKASLMTNLKRLKANSKQGAGEFLMEIETLAELLHINLISLIGYCNEHREMILVYDFMVNGTLADHLYRVSSDTNNCCSLTWMQRLKICIGAGRGLDYLHTGHGVIHRDIKSSNILLDENFEAKVADFGFVKRENRRMLQSHVSTKVKGTPGYFDPSYFTTCRLTRKSNTYSFGVVLLEILCGRRALDQWLEEGRQNLAYWARDKIAKGEAGHIVASCLKGEISPESLKTFVEVAERCLCDEPKKRPTMAQVVQQLESALEHQENKRLPVRDESVLSNIHHGDHENGLQANTWRPTAAPSGMRQQSDRLHNAEASSGREDRRRDTMYKLSRSWTWDAIRTFIKLLRKKPIKFKWSAIAASTGNFSPSNMIGRGVTGCVYKAVLPPELLVAVKRISLNYRYGLNEFKDEIHLLPKLRHENIIKLLGYRVNKEERILVYEFMENRSLDTFIVENHGLEWPVCFKIITGVARGIAYLHEDSSLKIIHKNLNPSNILLDAEFNPKIIGFAKAYNNPSGVASQLDGTCGYVSPEYALEGDASFMSDVYAFGVIVLQIVSGRKSHVYRYGRSLVSYASKLCSEGKALNLLDESIRGEFSSAEALRCIEVGLSCTQQEPNDRPTMRSVLKLLGGEEQPVEISAGTSPTGENLDLNSMEMDGFHGNGIVPEIDVATISDATAGFSSSNVIGRGGFGKTYKGSLANGQVFAVKRLNRSRNQGLREFTNELFLLPNLQHRNIVKLLGYCSHGEKLLIYEFMECGSLDALIFDKTRQPLQWSLRLKIMLGIARGILYLHQDSRLKIIHTDIKPSNILLDVEMNPKITDFGIARAMDEHESEIDAETISGTIGYISPEHLEGKLSCMSDVYSFGVTVLQVLSGREVRSLQDSNTSVIEHAWELWNDDKALDLVDESIRDTFPAEEALRCIKLGLLCTQEKPYHRPTIASVTKLLEGESLSLDLQEKGPSNKFRSFFGTIHEYGSDTVASFEHNDIPESEL